MRASKKAAHWGAMKVVLTDANLVERWAVATVEMKVA
jgi:hypothetical protein